MKCICISKFEIFVIFVLGNENLCYIINIFFFYNYDFRFLDVFNYFEKVRILICRFFGVLIWFISNVIIEEI